MFSFPLFPFSETQFPADAEDAAALNKGETAGNPHKVTDGDADADVGASSAGRRRHQNRNTKVSGSPLKNNQLEN